MQKNNHIFVVGIIFFLALLFLSSVAYSSVNNSIIILGEDHNSPKISTAVKYLIDENLNEGTPFDCIFVELPSDIKKSINDSLRKKSYQSYWIAVVDSKIDAMVDALRRLAFKVDDVETFRKTLESAYGSPDAKHPISKEVFDYIIQNKINLIPVDSSSDSQDLKESMYYQIKLESNKNIQAGDRISQFRFLEKRNEVMSINISHQMRINKCERSLLVVGYGHLFREKIPTKLFGVKSYNNLQTLLMNKNITSWVYIHSALTSYNFKGFVEDFVGEIYIK